MNTPIVGIYGLQNRAKPDKWYVGQSWDVDSRLDEYRRLHNCQSQQKIYNALKKYGIDGFNLVILERDLTDQSSLDIREDFWIIDKNSIKNGYNIRRGGSHGKHSEESKAKMRAWQVGKKLSEEHKRKIKASMNTPEMKALISETRKRRVISAETRKKQSDAMMGKQHSEETKRKISEGNRRVAAHRTDEWRERQSKSHVGIKLGPKTDEHKRKISEALKSYFSNKRNASL